MDNENEEVKNYFDSNTYVSVGDIMQKCGILHHTQFNTLARKFNLLPDEFFTEIGSGRGRKYNVKDASVFVEQVREYKSGQPLKEKTVTDLTEALHEVKEVYAKKFIRMAEEMGKVNNSLAMQNQKNHQYDKMESRVEVLSANLNNTIELFNHRMEKLEQVVAVLQSAVQEKDRELQNLKKFISNREGIPQGASTSKKPPGAIIV